MSALERSLSRGTVARYAAGSLGTGGFATLPGLVLIYYMTDTLGISPIVAGIVMTIAKLWDIAIDPWIGGQSDTALWRHGSRRRGMLVGSLALPMLFIVTFAVIPGIEPLWAALWVLVAFLATATAFSLFQVPYIALPAELTADYDDRTRLLSWRVVVLTLAILLFGAGGPEIRGLFEDSHTGYLVMAIVAGVTIGAGMLVAVTTAERGDPICKENGPRDPWRGYRDGVKALRRSRAFRTLLAAFVLQGLATGLMLAGAQYVATWVLGNESAVTPLFVALIAPALLVAPLWGLWARRVSKERIFLIASGLFVIATMSMTGLVWMPGSWVYIPVGLAGAAYAGMQSLPMAMLPDVISHDTAQTGTNRAGSFGGVWTAGETAGMALGATLLTILLASTGYQESIAGQSVQQADAVVTGITLSFSIVPAVLVLISTIAIRAYPLRRADITGSSV